MKREGARRYRIRWASIVAAGLGVSVVLSLMVGACAGLSGGGSEATTTVSDSSSTTAAVIETTTTEIPTTTTAGSLVSQESRDYAEWLGGGDHYGETLWFVIGQGALSSEAQAKTLLEPAKAVGDMQSNFIVQLSDNFQGMTPGYWIIFEAYYDYPSDDDLFFCKRPFPSAYVKQATVMTHDPIPVR